MTNEETNERIGKLRGWKYPSAGWRLFLSMMGQYYHGPPDYCGKWGYAGRLLEELTREVLAELDTNDKGEWCVDWDCESEILGKRRVWGKTATEAIANAWLAWKEAE